LTKNNLQKFSIFQKYYWINRGKISGDMLQNYSQQSFNFGDYFWSVLLEIFSEFVLFPEYFEKYVPKCPIWYLLTLYSFYWINWRKLKFPHLNHQDYG